MDVKGQVSVEYLLVILVVLIVLGTVTIPMIGSSVSSSSDVSKASDAKTAVDTIANAVNLVYANGPGAKRTLSVYMPVDSTLLYNYDKNNNMKVLSMEVTGVHTNSINPSSEIKSTSAQVSYKVNIVNPNVSKGWYNNVVVEWELNKDYITVTLA